jgi:hypothetical protein
MNACRYCIDTSALIDFKDRYPQAVFSTLWGKMEQLVEDDRLIAPHDVLEELKRGDDEITTWAKRHSKMFRQQDATLLRQASDVLRQVPDLADPNKAGAHADPFVVALAFIEHERGQSLLFEYSCVVVSHEGKSKGRRRIADACSHFGLECIILPTLFTREGWSF